MNKKLERESKNHTTRKEDNIEGIIFDEKDLVKTRLILTNKCVGHNSVETILFPTEFCRKYPSQWHQAFPPVCPINLTESNVIPIEFSSDIY